MLQNVRTLERRHPLAARGTEPERSSDMICQKCNET
jgi:hypothetical protein